MVLIALFIPVLQMHAFCRHLLQRLVLLDFLLGEGVCVGVRSWGRAYPFDLYFIALPFWGHRTRLWGCSHLFAGLWCGSWEHKLTAGGLGNSLSLHGFMLLFSQQPPWPAKQA